MNDDLISRSALLESFLSCPKSCENCNSFNENTGNCSLIENAPTVEEVSVIEFKEPLPMVKAQKIVKALSKRPQGECKTCRHRDPEDKKCDCGGLERQGCPFPVSDDYFCKYYEKGGAE